MEVKPIRGDGFCFLGAVSKVLEVDCKVIVPVQKAMDKIMKFLCENFERYTAYHQQKFELTAGDTLISDVIEFFSSCNYNTNIVDLLMQITTDCLDLDLNIFQNNAGQIQVYNLTTSNACYKVNFKFTHDLKHPQGNHYDAITKIPAVSTLKVLADVSDFYGWQPTKKEKSNTIPSSTAVIDLTDDDDGLIVPDQSGLRHMNSTADSLYGETTDIYSLSDETYISSEAECSGTGQYCIRSTPRSPSTGPPSTPSTEAHSDTTFSSTQASFLTTATCTIPTDFLTEPDTGDSDMDSVLSRDCDEDTQNLIQSVSRSRPFPTWYFDTVSPKFVKKIPDDIDGTKLYMVHICEHLWHVPTSDRCHFRMLTSRRKASWESAALVPVKVHLFATTKPVHLSEHHSFNSQTKSAGVTYVGTSTSKCVPFVIMLHSAFTVERRNWLSTTTQLALLQYTI